MASALRKPITGVWGRAPSGGPGAEPLVRLAEAERHSLFRRPKEGEIWPISRISQWLVLKLVEQSKCFFFSIGTLTYKLG